MSLSSQIRYARALDSSATDGSGKTGLAFGDITAKYLVQGGTLTSLTTETITTLGTYQAPTSAAHIRIKELSSSDPCKGVYEVHFHNTQVANSGKKLWLFLSAAGAAFQPLEVDLTDADGRLPSALGANGNIKADARDLLGTAWLAPGTAGTPDVNAKLAGGTAWNSGAIGSSTLATDAITSTGLATSAVQEIRNAITGGAYALDTDANGRLRIVDGTGTGELDTSSGTVTIGTNNDKTGYRLSATGVDDVWDEVQSGHTTAGTFGKYLDAAISGVSTGGVSAAAIAAAVWDQTFSGHVTDGTFGGLLNAAPAAVWAISTDAQSASDGSFGGALLAAPTDMWGVGTRTLTGSVAVSSITTNAITSAALATSAVQEIRDAITGYAGPLSTDATGSVRVVDGIGTGEIDTASGKVSIAQSDIDAVWTSTTRLLTAGTNIVLAKGTGVTGFNDLSAAAVNAEVVDALATDTYPEPTRGAPGATISLAAKLGYLYTSWRNRKTNDGTMTVVWNDANSQELFKQAVSETAGTVEKSEWITGA